MPRFADAVLSLSTQHGADDVTFLWPRTRGSSSLKASFVDEQAIQPPNQDARQTQDTEIQTNPKTATSKPQEDTDDPDKSQEEAEDADGEECFQEEERNANDEETELEEQSEKPVVPPLESPSDLDIHLKQILSPTNPDCASGPMTFQEMRDNLKDVLQEPRQPLKCYLDVLTQAGLPENGNNFEADLRKFDAAVTKLGSASIDPAERMSVTTLDVQNNLNRIGKPLAEAHASAERLHQWLTEFGNAVNSLLPAAETQAKNEVDAKLLSAIEGQAAAKSVQEQSLGSFWFTLVLPNFRMPGPSCRAQLLTPGLRTSCFRNCRLISSRSGRSRQPIRRIPSAACGSFL